MYAAESAPSSCELAPGPRPATPRTSANAAFNSRTRPSSGMPSRWLTDTSRGTRAAARDDLARLHPELVRAAECLCGDSVLVDGCGFGAEQGEQPRMVLLQEVGRAVLQRTLVEMQRLTVSGDGGRLDGGTKRVRGGAWSAMPAWSKWAETNALR